MSQIESAIRPSPIQVNQHLLEDFTLNLYPLSNLGIYHPPYEWIQFTFRRQRENNPLVTIGLYKNYRLFPFGEPDLVQQAFDVLANPPENSEISRLPDKITVVAASNLLLLPEGYKWSAEAVGYKRFSGNFPNKLELKMPNGYNIKLLNEDDIPLIIKLMTPPEGSKIEPDIYTNEVYFDERRLRGGLPYFGIFQDEKMLGITGTHGLVEDPTLERFAIVGDAFILPDYRRHGLAKALTAHAINYMINTYDIHSIGAEIRDNKPSYVALHQLGFDQYQSLIMTRNASRINTDEA